MFGTAHRIPYLAEPPKRTITLKGMALEMFHTLNNRSFIAMALASMFVAVGVGARNGLEIYFGLYFWELKQVQLAGLATMSEMHLNARYIANAVSVPVIADADNGYGNAINVIRTVREYIQTGVAGVHIMAYRREHLVHEIIEEAGLLKERLEAMARDEQRAGSIGSFETGPRPSSG